MFKLCAVLVLGLAAVAAQTADICSKPPPRVNPKECCDMPCPFGEELFKKCGGSMTPGSPPPFIPKTPGGECVTDCLFKEKKWVHGSEVDLSAMKNDILTGLKTNTTWLTIATNALTDCSSKILQGPPSLCQTKGDRVMMCTMGFMLARCPDTMYKKSATCDSLKEYISKCPPPTGPPRRN